MRVKKFSKSILLFALLCFAMVLCCKVEVRAEETDEEIPCQSVSFEQSEVTIKLDEHKTLKPTIVPANCTDDITYEASDYDILDIDDDGEIIGYEPGTVKVTICVGDKTATCKVTVEGIDCTSVSFKNDEITLDRCEDKQLKYTIKPKNTTDEITWTSSNPDIVEVDDNGVVTASDYGTAKITLKVGKQKATCKVKVRTIPCTSLTLSKDTLTLEEDDTKKLKATVNPKNCSDTVIWTSSDERVATVDDSGNVTGVSKGTAKITAKCGKKKATCKVTVNAVIITPAKGSIDATKEAASGDAYKTYTMYVPKKADAFLILSSEWSSLCKGTFSIVDGKGNAILKEEFDGGDGLQIYEFTFPKAGNYKLKFKKDDYYYDPDFYCSLKERTMEIPVCTEEELFIWALESQKDIKWTVKDKSYAKVQKGTYIYSDNVLHALKKGSTTLTGKIKNGPTLTIKVKIVDTEPVVDGRMSVGYYGGCSLSLYIANPADKKVKYVYLDTYFYNKVDDIVRDDITRDKYVTLKLTGPIEKWSVDKGYWEYVFYNTTANYARVKKVKYVYMDGSSKTYNVNKKIKIVE